MSCHTNMIHRHTYMNINCIAFYKWHKSTSCTPALIGYFNIATCCDLLKCHKRHRYYLTASKFKMTEAQIFASVYLDIERWSWQQVRWQSYGETCRVQALERSSDRLCEDRSILDGTAFRTGCVSRSHHTDSNHDRSPNEDQSVNATLSIYEPSLPPLFPWLH